VARYKIAKDGHRYLTQGYPVIDKRGQDDVRFSTYQVNTGAERVFDRAGFEDGDKVSEETFYALLLDGDLYNDARPNAIEASAIPNRILTMTDYEAEKSGLDQFSLSGATCLLDVFEQFVPHTRNPLFALSVASWLWIFTHRKRYDSKSYKV
jgi:hypothetical protein